jgi:hypothetical protein
MWMALARLETEPFARREKGSRVRFSKTELLRDDDCAEEPAEPVAVEKRMRRGPVIEVGDECDPVIGRELFEHGGSVARTHDRFRQAVHVTAAELASDGRNVAADLQVNERTSKALGRG